MITREDLPVGALEAAYDLGPWRSVELLPAGKSDHYRVATEDGEYVVRRSYLSKGLEDIRFEHELIAHLRESSFPAPVVVSTASGDTWLAVDGDLYSVSVFVRGDPYHSGNTEHLREAARALAEYHRIIQTFRPSSMRIKEQPLNDVLRERLAGMPSSGVTENFARDCSDQEPRLPRLMELLPYVVKKGEEILDILDSLYPSLPALIIHGGCRRGSTLFSEDRLITMLDFDSARPEARVMDLAIALHDFGKVFGDPDSPDFKVPLDLDVVASFLAAYRELNPLEPSEIEALPAMLAARPLKRALGKYRSMIEDRRISPGHVRKTAQEVSRVRWLEAHERELQVALRGTI